MRKTTVFAALITVLLLNLIMLNPLEAQRGILQGNQHRVIGWTDDTHFLFETFDSDQQPVIQNVDIRTGRRVVVPPSKTELDFLNESLPKGVFIGFNDIVSPDYTSVIFLKDNDLFYFRKGDREISRLTRDEAPEINTRFSPDGRKVAYTKNKDMYVYDLANRKEIRLSFDASDRIYNGYASWVYMEEILGRSSRYAAFWWSPDGSKLAYLRTDESDVPIFTLNRLDEADGTHGLLEQVPYPKPGDPNPKVKMGIAEIATAKTVWVKTDDDLDQYIAWPFWDPDSKKLAIQVLNRDQNDLRFILADPTTGDNKEIHREYRKTWVEFFEDIYVMRNGSGFILRSYRDDWENLYYHDWDGKLKSQLTSFDWRVSSILRVDEDARLVYFTGTGPESTDNHCFRVGLDGKDLLQMTSGPGAHTVSISPKGTYFIDSWNNITTPGSITAFDRRGKAMREIHKFEQPVFDPAKHAKVELLRIKSSDGLFEMPAIITYPLNFDPLKKYPVIFRIYGGPDSKNISANSWQGVNPSWDAQNGIITFTVDHRASGHFGKKGLDYMHRSLGKWEVLDYIDAVRWLREKPFVDPSRMGITGSSYGGYITCLALTKGADYWTHGFAGASVTDWRLYDNIYTERFMDAPQENPGGYREGSVLTFASDYKGKLFFTHGDIDDNVHMQNSIYLISRLQDEGKTFQFMMYPGNRHGYTGAKALHSRNEANNFWLSSFFGR